MRTTRRSAGPLLFALFAVAGCGGGGISGIGQQGGGESQGDDVIGGDAEIAYDTGTVGAGIDPRCASGSPIGTGQACGTAGLHCPLGTIDDCNGATRTLECACDGETWSCDPIAPTACPTPTSCPDPSTLVAGSPCALPPGQQCVSTDIPVPNCGNGALPPSITKALCTCMGTWFCPVTPMTCAPPPVPASTCPDPYSVYAQQSCNGAGLTCRGNPTFCGNGLFYDALECIGGSWITIAATNCDVDDGGSFDGETLDGGVPDAHVILDD
jgi:hypothetical protein